LFIAFPNIVALLVQCVAPVCRCRLYRMYCR